MTQCRYSKSIFKNVPEACLVEGVELSIACHCLFQVLLAYRVVRDEVTLSTRIFVGSYSDDDFKAGKSFWKMAIALCLGTSHRCTNSTA